MLKEKTAIITGAARGIGKALALALMQEGIKLCLVDRDEQGLNELAREITDKGGSALVVAYDLLKDDSAQVVIGRCAEEFGGIDILINNAGYAERNPYDRITKEEFMKHMVLNAYVPLAMTQQAVPYLKKSDLKIVINMSSITSINPYECQGSYVASKHAQRGITQVMAMELFEEDIRIHTIAPTGVDTEMIAITRPDLNPDMFCKKEEIAEIVLFLLNHRNNSIIDEIVVRRHSKKPCEL